MKNIREELLEIFGDRLKENEPLAKHLNFRLGGPATFFAEVKTVEELTRGIDLAEASNVPWFALGGGSNTLASDDGFDGVVFKLAMRSIEINGQDVAADAGVISAALARQTAQAGLKGFTWAISLPGTIGGAVRGNAGCFGGETRDNLVSVDVLRDGKVLNVPAKDLAFGYRESAIKHSKDVVLRAYFRFEKGDPEQLKEDLHTKVMARKDSQPLYAGSAGCIFKNFEASDDEVKRVDEKLELPLSMKESHRIGSGWIVDQLGLKGTRVGDAEISDEHGNFMINHGNATASDIRELVEMVKAKVREELGIELQEEVQYLGFQD